MVYYSSYILRQQVFLAGVQFVVIHQGQLLDLQVLLLHEFNELFIEQEVVSGEYLAVLEVSVDVYSQRKILFDDIENRNESQVVLQEVVVSQSHGSHS